MANARVDLTDRKKTRAIIEEPAPQAPPPSGTETISDQGPIVMKISIIEATTPAEQPARYMSDVKT